MTAQTMDSASAPGGRYEEVQSLPRWTWLIAGLLAVIFDSIAFIQIVMQTPVGDRPMSNVGVVLAFLVFGLAIPFMMVILRFKLVVEGNRLQLSLPPYYKREVSVCDIARLEETDIQPAHFGGWGIRRRDGITAWIFKGRTGLKLTMKDGCILVISLKDARQASEIIRAGMDGGWAHPASRT